MKKVCQDDIRLNIFDDLKKARVGIPVKEVLHIHRVYGDTGVGKLFSEDAFLFEGDNVVFVVGESRQDTEKRVFATTVAKRLDKVDDAWAGASRSLR